MAEIIHNYITRPEADHHRLSVLSFSCSYPCRARVSLVCTLARGKGRLTDQVLGPEFGSKQTLENHAVVSRHCCMAVSKSFRELSSEQ